MRLALLSDLHGNELALMAVLADVAKLGTDRIVCLGDTATLGPRPREVLSQLRELGCDCILGNHDAFMLDPQLIHRYNDAPIIVEAVDWCRSQLSAEELRFIESFAPSLELALDATPCFLYHGTPRSHMEDLISTTQAERVDEMLSGRRATVMAGGHTHVPMLRQHRGMLLVNPGSVGAPFEEYVHGKVPRLLPHAEWALVEAKSGRVSVTLHRVELERAALRKAATAVNHPLDSWLATQYS